MSDQNQTTHSLVPERVATSSKIEIAAKALAWSELTEHGRKVCDWMRDFSEQERQEYRAKAMIVLDALEAEHADRQLD